MHPGFQELLPGNQKAHPGEKSAAHCDAQCPRGVDPRPPVLPATWHSQGPGLVLGAGHGVLTQRLPRQCVGEGVPGARHPPQVPSEPQGGKCPIQRQPQLILNIYQSMKFNQLCEVMKKELITRNVFQNEFNWMKSLMNL